MQGSTETLTQISNFQLLLLTRDTTARHPVGVNIHIEAASNVRARNSGLPLT